MGFRVYNATIKSADEDKVERSLADQRVPGWCEGHGCAFEISSSELPEEQSTETK